MFRLFLDCYWNKYAQFSGRASRQEFWSFMLFHWLLFIVVLISAKCIIAFPVITFSPELSISFPASSMGRFLLGADLMIIFIVLSCSPALAVLVRRLHDLNLSDIWAPLCITFIIVSYINIGNNYYISIIYIIIFITLTIACCLKGTTGTNHFGTDPLATKK